MDDVDRPARLEIILENDSGAQRERRRQRVGRPEAIEERRSEPDLVVGHDAAPPRQFDPVFHHAAPVEHDALGLCRAARGIEDEGRVVTARPGDRCGEIVRGYVAAAGKEIGPNSEERRLGEEGGSTGSCGWYQYN